MTGFLIGGYGPDKGGSSPGILAARGVAGALEVGGVVAELASPSWLARDGDLVHAALEGASAVASLAFEPDGTLRLLATAPTGSGAAPCHLAVATRPDGSRVLLVARYLDGVVAVHALEGAVGPVLQELPGEGRGPLPAQKGPRAHHVLVLSDGRIATCDLGADRVLLHRWEGALLARTASIPLPPGTGPRDLLALPDGRLAVLGEWSCAIALLRPAGESFELEAVAPLPGADGASQAAALALSRDGRHLVAGIRGANRIAVLRLEATGARAVGDVDCGGSWPRHLVVDGDLVHVANQLSGTIASFRLAADGSLAALGAPVAAPSPTCLLPLG